MKVASVVLAALCASAPLLASAQAPSSAAPAVVETRKGKGTFGIEAAKCDGDGTFSGEAEYQGEGEFMSESGTFVGEGVFYISSGSIAFDGADQKWVCEGNGTFLLPAKTGQAKFSGNGTITGDGTFSTPTGTFSGSGKYEGNSVVFTNDPAAKAKLTLEQIMVTEQDGAQPPPAPAGALSIAGSGLGPFVGAGQFQGSGTCRGNGTLHGSGTLKGSGKLLGSGTMVGKGSMDGSGTFEGKGECSGSSVRFYET